MRSPLFQAYHDGQPFNENMMQPCPMLENPAKLRAMVEKTGAKSTDMQSPETADHLCAKCDSYELRAMVEKTGAKSTDMQSPETADHLCAKCDSYAACWAPKAEEIWEARKEEKARLAAGEQ